MIDLPHGYQPRPYQIPLWKYFTGDDRTGKRACAVWHRRAGKDTSFAHLGCWLAHRRIGTYWHMLPEANQGRKVVWEGIDKEGRRLIDTVFPAELRAATPNQTEMMVRLKCGSVWQVVGSDNYTSLLGSNPVGIVFSEWSLADPAAWDYLRPILRENGGWAGFIFTPRGYNHGWDTFQVSRENPDWFSQILTVDDTGVLTQADLDAERAEGMSDDMIDQEYRCDFSVGMPGAYYGKALQIAEQQGRITRVPWESRVPITTAWDLGIGDDTAIWFVQQVGKEMRVIDYYANRGVDLAHYAKILKERPYVYHEHLLPHDAAAKELGTGRSREEVLRALHIGRIRVLPQQRVEDGIEATRGLLPRCWFDADKCKPGLDALRQYRREWDDKRKAFQDRPRHDWTSHAADAFRYLAMGIRPVGRGPQQPYFEDPGYDVGLPYMGPPRPTTMEDEGYQL